MGKHKKKHSRDPDKVRKRMRKCLLLLGIINLTLDLLGLLAITAFTTMRNVINYELLYEKRQAYDQYLMMNGITALGWGTWFISLLVDIVWIVKPVGQLKLYCCLMCFAYFCIVRCISTVCAAATVFMLLQLGSPIWGKAIVITGIAVLCYAGFIMFIGCMSAIWNWKIEDEKSSFSEED